MKVGDMVWTVVIVDGLPAGVEPVKVAEIDLATGESPSWLHETREAAVAALRGRLGPIVAEREAELARLRGLLAAD